MANVIIVILLVVIVSFAIRYIYRTKKSGGCSGCPNAESCKHKGECY